MLIVQYILIYTAGEIIQSTLFQKMNQNLSILCTSFLKATRINIKVDHVLSERCKFQHLREQPGCVDGRGQGLDPEQLSAPATQLLHKNAARNDQYNPEKYEYI